MTTVEERPLVLAPSFEDDAKRVDEAIAAASTLDPHPRRTALELKDAVEAFHKPALLHIVRTLKADPRGKELLFELVDDPQVHAVLALHGIVRASLQSRAQAALETVRPYLQSHGGDVELVDIIDGIAQVRLHGSCNGCSMSAVTLREGVEEGLVKGVAEITGIEVLADEPTAAFIPLGAIGKKESGWVAGPNTEDVPVGGMLRVDIDDDSFIVTNIENRFAVFRNECVHQGMTLDGGMIDEGILTCPWHGFRYDASSGECMSAPGAQLPQIPLRIDGGRVFIRAH